jgi:hypothetical protein
LLEAPRSLENNPRARVYIIDHVPPGATIRRKVEVSDGTPYRLDIGMYAAGATITGGAWAPFGGTQQDELSGWITERPGRLQLDSGQNATVEVTVAVPHDAAPGERYAVIWAQATVPNGSNVREVARVGIRVYLSVGNGAAPAEDFRIDSLTAARTTSGRPEVLAEVHNTGGRALDLSGTLTLGNGPGGLSAGPFRAELGTTLGIGQTEPVRVLLDPAIPAGPWLARIVLRSGLTTRAAEGEISFPSAPGASSSPVPAKPVPLSRNRAVWVPVAAALIGLVLLGLLVLLLWKRRRREEAPAAARAGRRG